MPVTGHRDMKIYPIYQRTGDRGMKRVSEKQYKALTSCYNVKIVSADDRTVLVKLVGKID